jgi:hypothetical protein
VPPTHPEHPSAPDPAHAHLLLSATLYLMSTFALERSCVRLAETIEQHLQLLVARDDADPLVRSTCAQLRAKWHDSIAAYRSRAAAAAQAQADEVPERLPQRLH